MTRTTAAALTGRLLAIIPVQLNANYNSTANTATQVVGNMLAPLPIIVGRRCTVELTMQLYSVFGPGNTQVYGRIGPASDGLANFPTANVYASGTTQQTVWSNDAVATNLDLSVQQYVSMTVQNDASSVIGFSANAFRTALIAKVYNV